jgi:carnitine O-acetyltransferase
LLLRYETASTRLFKRGRTETIRSCTSEAAQLSAAVCARNYPVDQPMCDAYLYTLFTRALAKHKQLTQEAMAGQVRFQTSLTSQTTLRFVLFCSAHVA